MSVTLSNHPMPSSLQCDIMCMERSKFMLSHSSDLRRVQVSEAYDKTDTASGV